MTIMYKISSTNEGGFTLIELMITAAVIAILSAIALPSYNQHVLRGHRAEARNTLLAVAQRLEQNYTLYGTYAQTQLPPPAPVGLTAVDNSVITSWGLGQTPLSGPARYNITFAAANPTATTFTLQAINVGAQATDTCGILMVDNRNLKGAVGVLDNRAQITRDCWDR